MENLTLKELKEVNELFSQKTQCEVEKEFEVGEKYLVRGVTLYHLGKVVRETEKLVIFENSDKNRCGWVADTGRFSALDENKVEENGSSEIELFPKNKKEEVRVRKDTIVDFFEYDKELPKKSK